MTQSEDNKILLTVFIFNILQNARNKRMTFIWSKGNETFVDDEVVRETNASEIFLTNTYSGFFEEVTKQTT